MIVGIIGMGYVGSAVASSLPDNLTVKYDPIVRPYNSTDFNELLNCDAVVICVPTPTRYDGSCNTSIILSTLEKLESFKGVIISKSTAPPTFYEKMFSMYPNLVYVPEFLRANSATDDYTSTQIAIYGGAQHWAGQASKALTQGTYRPSKSIFTDIKTAALYKYLTNSFLATKVVWMNEFKDLADSLGVKWNDIRMLCDSDARIGIGHTQVPGPDGHLGYGGGCFPKDINAILSLAKGQGIELSVLDQVVAKNDKIRQKI